MGLEEFVIDMHAAAGTIPQHVYGNDAEMLYQSLVNLVCVAGIATETVEHQKRRLAVLHTFFIIKLENFLVTKDEGSNLYYIAAAETKVDVFTQYLVIRHLAEPQDLHLGPLQRCLMSFSSSVRAYVNLSVRANAASHTCII